MPGKQAYLDPWKDSGTHWPPCYSNSSTVGGSVSDNNQDTGVWACESHPPALKEAPCHHHQRIFRNFPVRASGVELTEKLVFLHP